MAVRCVLLDIGGVLYVGDEPLPGARRALKRLRDAEMPLRFLTNTTSSPKRKVLEKLGRMGFEVGADELFAPAAAAHAWLAERRLSPWLLTAPELEEDFAGFDGDAGIAVVVGDAGPGFTYGRLNEAFRLLTDGAPLVALGRNRYFRKPEGLTLDAGPFVAALEYAAGVEATVLGKPAPAFFNAALASAGRAPDEAVMVGDDWEADVNGAVAAGLGGMLVRTGKYGPGDEDRLKEGASAVDDLGAAVTAILDAHG